MSQLTSQCKQRKAYSGLAKCCH